MASSSASLKDQHKLINEQSNDKRPLKVKKQKKKKKSMPLTPTMKKVGRLRWNLEIFWVWLISSQVLAHRNFIERQRRNPPTPTSQTSIRRQCTLIVQCLSSEVFRDNPTTPTPSIDQTFYTEGRVVDRETFSRLMLRVFDKAALGPPGNEMDKERRQHLCAFLLDFFLEQSIELAAEELKRKFKK